MRRIKLLFCLLAGAFWAFAQSTPPASAAPSAPQTPGTTTTQSTSAAGSTAVIEQNNASVPREFLGAVAGVVGTAGPFPGMPVLSSDWQLYRPLYARQFSMEEIDRMKRKFHVGDILPIAWKNRVRSVVIDPNQIKPNHDSIQLVNWWPGVIGYEKDKVIGRITVIGDYLYPEELYLGLGLAEAKKLTHTTRVAIRTRLIREGVTKGMSIGAGGTGARITQPGLDNDAIAAATGGIIGVNRVLVEDYVEFEILCLNDGPVVTPVLPEPPKPAQPTPAPLPTPLPQTFIIKIDPIKLDPELSDLLASVVKTQRYAPPPPAPPAAPTCDSLPGFTVLFDFDKSAIKSEFFPKIVELASWLNAHPACNVQVEGHTDKVGTTDYNAALGMRRSTAIYDALIVAGGNRQQIQQHASLGKSFPKGDLDPENRRVILRVIGPASGK